MKKVLAILLLACVSYQLVAKMGIMVWYEVNKDYIAEELCENKDKPKLQCNGNCYLNKQIAKVDDQAPEKDGAQLPKKIEKSEITVMFSTAELQLNFTEHTANIRSYYDNYIPPRGIQPLSSVFHPPQMLA